MPATRPDLSRLPATVRLAPAEVILAEENDDRSFSMLAYTGAEVNVGFGPVVFDLATMRLPGDAQAPAFRQHDPTKWVGMIDAMDLASDRLRVRGALFDDVEAADEVRRLSRAGAKWQASVGLRLDVKGLEFVDEGEEATVNDRVFAGPVIVARNTKLREVSFVPLGADDETDAAVYAADKESTMADPKPTTPAADPMTRVNEIHAAFADDPAFALEAITKGWSLLEAKAELGVRLSAKLDEERKAREKAEAELAAEKERAAQAATTAAGRSSPASSLGGEPGQPGGQAQDPIATYEAAVRAEVASLGERGHGGFRRGLPFPASVNLRTQAIHNIARREPDLHAAYMEAAEQRRAAHAAARAKAGLS